MAQIFCLFLKNKFLLFSFLGHFLYYPRQSKRNLTQWIVHFFHNWLTALSGNIFWKSVLLQYKKSGALVFSRLRLNFFSRMSEKKAVIKNADMSEDMQSDVVECATQALEKYNIEKDIAAYIKKEFDKKYRFTLFKRLLGSWKLVNKFSRFKMFLENKLGRVYLS